MAPANRDPAAPVLTCELCGCTDEEACGPDGCSWVVQEPTPACSACVLFLLNVRSVEKRTKILDAAGVKNPKLVEILDMMRDALERGIEELVTEPTLVVPRGAGRIIVPGGPLDEDGR